MKKLLVTIILMLSFNAGADTKAAYGVPLAGLSPEYGFNFLFSGMASGVLYQQLTTGHAIEKRSAYAISVGSIIAVGAFHESHEANFDGHALLWNIVGAALGPLAVIHWEF